MRCVNINWAKRNKCSICNTNKPDHNEGGVRGGRGGGYKELDEEELEETRRRRKEAEEDDGEMYDEFGNLKKKFLAKTRRSDAGQLAPGAGRAGWEVEELGVSERESSERSKDYNRDRFDEAAEKERDMIGRGEEAKVKVEKEMGGCEKDRGRERDCAHDYERGREHGRERGRHWAW